MCETKTIKYLLLLLLSCFFIFHFCFFVYSEGEKNVCDINNLSTYILICIWFCFWSRKRISCGSYSFAIFAYCKIPLKLSQTFLIIEFNHALIFFNESKFVWRLWIWFNLPKLIDLMFDQISFHIHMRLHWNGTTVFRHLSLIDIQKKNYKITRQTNKETSKRL